MKKSNKLKLNYYYLPKKSQYKLNENIVPVVPIATDNDFLIDLLLFNIEGQQKDDRP